MSFSICSFQDKSEADVEKIKSTVMLCYGYLTLYASADLVVSRLEANILKNISPYLANVKVCCYKPRWYLRGGRGHSGVVLWLPHLIYIR